MTVSIKSCVTPLSALSRSQISLNDGSSVFFYLLLPASFLDSSAGSMQEMQGMGQKGNNKG